MGQALYKVNSYSICGVDKNNHSTFSKNDFLVNAKSIQHVGTRISGGMGRQKDGMQRILLELFIMRIAVW